MTTPTKSILQQAVADLEDARNEVYVRPPGAANKIDDAITALRSLEGEDGWRDIDTAPMDGTPILTWAKGFKPFICEYDTDDQCWDFDGWMPTHWCPLPAAPSHDEEKR